MSAPRVSVVVPARDASETLGKCLRALEGQNLAQADFELIVVVDLRSTDSTAEIAQASAARVVAIRPEHDRRFTAGARNAGTRAATGEWVAFTDADCIPSRGWLRALLAAAATAETDVVAVAGPTLGLDSRTQAARYVDLTGGLGVERHLGHPRFPWPPAGNAMYRRDALLQVGGYDPRFTSYEQADLHLRLTRQMPGGTVIAQRAVVHHRHRSRWRDYARQQLSYGSGYAQFYVRYGDELRWTAAEEARAWLALLPLALRALMPGRADAVIRRRGEFVKRGAQRIGFARTFWSRAEAARWQEPAPASTEADA